MNGIRGLCGLRTDACCHGIYDVAASILLVYEFIDADGEGLAALLLLSYGRGEGSRVDSNWHVPPSSISEARALCVMLHA